MTKATWCGYEIYMMYNFHKDWCEIGFWMSDYESPITGTGRRKVRLDEIVVEEA